MFYVSPRGKKVITQGRDLTQYEEITPQLDTRAKQPQLRQTLADCGGSKVSQFGGSWGQGPASHLGLSCQSIPGQVGWHRLTAVPQQPMCSCGKAERLRECSGAPLPLGEPLLC